MDTSDALRHVRPAADLERARISASVRSRFLGTPPLALGRFVLGEKLGSGGSGLVYEAFDPELRRKVAIKVLHDRRDAEPFVRREGAALARIDHPNVVPLFDLLVTPHGPALVMRRLEGITLAAWAAEPRVSAPQVLEAFFSAANGLAAIHDAGLVHRDFKPDNVIVGDDGHVWLIDLGLVIEEHARDVALGTWRYMSPEQAQGRPVDARSDQYSFCVALQEVLERRDPAAWRHVQSVVTRGRAPDPTARWPSMRRLARAIRHAANRRGRGKWMLAALVLAGSGALAASLRPSPPRCPDWAARAPSWSPARADAVARALSDARVPADAARSTLRHFETFAAEWSVAKDAVCSEHARDREPWRPACLAVSAGVFEIAVAAAEHVSGRHIPVIEEQAARLTAPSTCARAGPSARLWPLDRDGVVLELADRRDLHATEVERLANRWDDARAIATEVWSRARERGDCTVSADAAVAAGSIESGAGRRDVALAWFDQALWLALGCHHDRAAVVAAGLAAAVSANQRDRSTFAHYRAVTSGAMGRLVEPGMVAAAEAHASSIDALLAGRTDDARAAAQHAVDIALESHSETSVTTAVSRIHLATIHLQSQHPREAAVELQRAERALAQLLPPDHDRYLNMLDMLAAAEGMSGRVDTAVRRLERVVQLRRGHADVAALITSLVNLGTLQIDVRAWTGAQASLEEATRLLREHAPDDARKLGHVYERLGIIALDRGDLPVASKWLTASLVERESAFGGDDREVAHARTYLALLRRAQGRDEEASALLNDALRNARASPADPRLEATILVNLGGIHLDGGAPQQATEVFARALELQREIGANDLDLGRTTFALAQAAWASGETAPTEDHVEEARTLLERAGSPTDLDALTQWDATRRADP